MRRAVLSLAAAALSASRPACAFAPSTQVRGRAQQLPLGVAGTSLGGLAPPSGKPHAASRSGQTQTAAAAGTLLPADPPLTLHKTRSLERRSTHEGGGASQQSSNRSSPSSPSRRPHWIVSNVHGPNRASTPCSNNIRSSLVSASTE